MNSSTPRGNCTRQAHEEQFPVASLDKLGDQLKLPAGCKFRPQVLTDDLVLDLGPGKTFYPAGDEYHQYFFLAQISYITANQRDLS